MPSTVDDVEAVAEESRQRVEDLVVGGVGIQEDDVVLPLNRDIIINNNIIIIISSSSSSSSSNIISLLVISA